MKIGIITFGILTAFLFFSFDRLKFYKDLYYHIDQLENLPKLKNFENLNIHYSFISSNKDLLKSHSLLTPMNNEGEVLVCIDSKVALSREAKDHIEALCDDSINSWNKLLNAPGVPWKQESINVNFEYARQNKPCSESSHLIFNISKERIRPYAIFLMKSIHIGIADLSYKSPFASTYLTHEIGHIIGLSDTYSDVKSKQIIAYPISIMSTARNIDKISRSDHEAITQLWNYMNLDIDLCETIEGARLRTVNWNDSYTCVSKLVFGISSLVWGESRSLEHYQNNLQMLGTSQSPYQSWVAKQASSSGSYYFKLRDQNLCLHLYTQNRIGLAKCSENQRQYWEVEAWRPMIFYIKNQYLGKDACLALHPNSQNQLSMQSCQHYKYLLWKINNQS